MDTRTLVAAGAAVAASLWLALSLVVLIGRSAHDTLRRPRSSQADLPRTTRRRLYRRARRHRTELGRWRRASALVELSRPDGRSVGRALFRDALADRDEVVRSAAVRALGHLAERHEWARQLLIEALQEDRAPRSRVAAELEAVECGDQLGALLDDDRAPVRYWAAMLLGRYPAIAETELVRLVDDVDPAVRRAAIESLAHRRAAPALTPVLARLTDDVMYVRAHACRAAARLGGPAVAAQLAPLLADEAWWVRNAAKDALRSFGIDAASTLVDVLESDDRFARNGSAEVLQDLGVVDQLLLTDPASPMLERIFAAGEHGLLEAARRRLGLDSDAPVIATLGQPEASSGEVAAA